MELHTAKNLFLAAYPRHLDWIIVQLPRILRKRFRTAHMRTHFCMTDIFSVSAISRLCSKKASWASCKKAGFIG
ncbi:hypothetical protein DPMN_136978 [Dreissena polymorpha]|uniref:Uncharacterized protein n=1 Tax=Dreissena polymorpha TaxID=45954 RepID=A0A9D4G1R9_DREPO|nr:hypothetical protein DPMN_136978 [Dreissena polymorpha]